MKTLDEPAACLTSWLSLPAAERLMPLGEKRAGSILCLMDASKSFWVLRSCSVKALMERARAWLYWAKNLLPHKYADYLGGGSSSHQPLCSPAESLKPPCPVEEEGWE